MAEKKEAFGGKQAKPFSKGKDEAPRKGKPKAAETSKTKEAKASKGGRRERETE